MPRRSADNAALWVDDGIDIPGKTLRLFGGVDEDLLERTVTGLYLLGTNTDITVLLNSGGGDTKPGLVIYDLLKSHAGTVTIRVIGQAASMACIILQAGDVRQATPNSILMHHVGVVEYPAEHPENFGRFLKFSRRHDDKLDQIMLDRVNEHMRETEQQQWTMTQWRNRDTWDRWMFPDEAISIGLLDEVYP